MGKVLLISTLILSFLPAKAVFTNFASPEKKPPIKRIVSKKTMKREREPKKKKIKDAVIWRLPQREFLGKNFTKEEELLIDAEALERFIEAASLKNPDAFQIYKSKHKNSKLINTISNYVRNDTNSNFLQNYIEAKAHHKKQETEIVLQEIKHIEKLYQKLKMTFQAQSRSSKADYEDLKIKITACCGLENFLYVENLLKREIHFEVFNT